MRKCPYCGREYADDAALCVVDESPLIGQGELSGNIAAQPNARPASFSVKLVNPISSTGTYLVFVERGDLLFICLEAGSTSILEAAVPFLGPLGGLIPLAGWLFTRRKAKSNLQRFEERDPEELLRENERSFKLHLSEIRDAAIEPPALIAMSGRTGRLTLTVRHGEAITCEFDDAAELSNAIRWLGVLFNSTLRVNVEWNKEKQRFQKKSR